MRFERENKNPVENPSSRRIEAELRKLRSEGPSSFASLTNHKGDFLQVAGGGGGCLVERRDAVGGRQFRAYQDDPVVPFEDGTELCFSSGRVPLRSREWFRMNQAVEIFVTFNEGRPLPEYVRWRDIAEVLAGASSKARSKITSRSCSVDSSPNKQWQPRWGFEGKPHDVVIYTTKAGPRPLAATQHPEGIRQAVADFLERWLADTPPSEEEATASFLYVVLSRPPTRNDYVIDVRNVGPLVEFGFGEAPAAPEEWESIPLGDLIRRATHWLRATNSS